MLYMLLGWRRMGSFAGEFRRLVAPRLKDIAETGGRNIAHGFDSYLGVCDRVMAEAVRLGSIYLDEEIQEHLEAQIGEWITAAIDRAWTVMPPDEVEAWSLKCEHISDDCDRYFQRWAHAIEFLPGRGGE